MAKKTSLKSKIIKKKSTVKVIKKFDPYKSKILRIEYFDDRFYRVTADKSIPKEEIANIPENRRLVDKSKLYLYLDSVTTIQSNTTPKKYLATWRGNIGNAEADKQTEIALTKGSNIHNSCEKLALGYTIVFQNPKAFNSVPNKQITALKKKSKIHIVNSMDEMIQIERFKRVLAVLQPNILETERNVFSFEKCYAGTLDQTWDIEAGTYTISRSNILSLEKGFYLIDFKTGKSFDEKDYYTQISAYAKAHPSKDQIKGCLIVHLNADIRSGIYGVKIYHVTLDMIEEYYEHFCNLLKIYRFKDTSHPAHYTINPIITPYKYNKPS